MMCALLSEKLQAWRGEGTRLVHIYGARISIHYSDILRFLVKICRPDFQTLTSAKT